MTPAQQHIAAHCRNGRYDASKSAEDNVSIFNRQCLVGMIETGEITWKDLEAVGGVDLAGMVGKMMQRKEMDREERDE